MVTGKKKIKDIAINKKDLKFNTKNPDKTKLIEELKETLKTNDVEYEYLDAEKKYIKVSIIGRIDLETMTIDARYVAEETNVMFSVVTDEVDSFLGKSGEFISDEAKSLYEKSRQRVENFVEETIDTNFKKKISSPITKRKYSDVFGAKAAAKSFYSIDVNNVFSSDKIRLREDLFRIETDGYWKKIGVDDIGLDKKGNPIHGRTWVNQKSSWFEGKEEDLIVEKNTEPYSGANAGYIYILRNPTMEKNIFKIGRTRNDVDDRVDQLSKTSVPDKFYKSQEWNVRDCVLAEREIHKKLNDFRIDPRREFFQIEYDKAIKVIKEIVDEINRS